MEKNSPSLFSLTCLVAFIHFFICLVIGFIVFTVAFGQGLSDSYQEESPLQSILTLILTVLEAPIALVQWIATKYHPQAHTGLPLSCLVCLGALWSIAFGWLSAMFYRQIKQRKL